MLLFKIKKIIFCFFIILFSLNSGFAHTLKKISKIISYGDEMFVFYSNGKIEKYIKGYYVKDNKKNTQKTNLPQKTTTQPKKEEKTVKNDNNKPNEERKSINKNPTGLTVEKWKNLSMSDKMAICSDFIEKANTQGLLKIDINPFTLNFQYAFGLVSYINAATDVDEMIFEKIKHQEISEIASIAFIHMDWAK